MEPLSDKTEKLIQGLYAGQRLWWKLIVRPDPPLQALEEIASSGEVLAIPALVGFLLDGRADVREATARAIGRLMANVPSSELAQFDERCRKDWSYDSLASSLWRRLEPTEVKRFCHLSNTATVLGVTSCHPNGFIRDAAVNELTDIFDGSELPFLLVRLNDWVGAVRESAATAVRARIRPDYATHFFRHLRLISRLHSCGRAEHEQFVTAVTDLLQQPSAVPLLREGLLSNDSWLRRESFRMAVAAPSAERAALLKEILGEADPIMRLWAARHSLGHLEDGELRPILTVLVRDRFMPVRCAALNHLAHRCVAEAYGELREALFDTHSSVRALARYWLRTQRPDFDFASSYRRSLTGASSVPRRGAILGLGETGVSADAQMILSFLNSPVVGMRKAAIRALAALDGDSYLEQFIAALTDGHPGISNEATKALSSRAIPIMHRLQALFETETRSHVRRKLFKLLADQSFWPRGILLLQGLRDRDEHIVASARDALRDWLRRSGSMPTAPDADELRHLRDALNASASLLAPHEAKELEFCLKAHG